MIVNCHYCEARVDGIILTEHAEYVTNFDSPQLHSFLECPVCRSSILVGQECVGYDESKDAWFYGSIQRLWPEPEKYLGWKLPDLVHDSLEEARKCYRAKAYNACAVMCGKTLEGICFEYKCKSRTLANGLKELLNNNIIDKRFFAWAEALREHRNLGAHASGKKTSGNDAKDLLEFTNAICDYIFVLTKKFENFMQRKEQKRLQKQKSENLKK